MGYYMDYSLRLAARVLLYVPSHRQDSTYNGRWVQMNDRSENSSLGLPRRIDLKTNRTLSERSTTELHLAPH